MKPTGMRPVVVATGRQPFELAVLVAAATAGLSLILTGVSPKSTAAAMPFVVQALWQWLLVAGGVIGLCGVTWPGKLVVRLGTEATGIVLLGTATTMYAIALFTVSGLQALAAGSFVTAVAVGSWARFVQICRDVRRAAAAADAGYVRDVPLLVEDRP